MYFEWAAIFILLTIVFITVKRNQYKLRSQWIEQFAYPPSLTDKIIAKYPHLTAAQADYVITALKEYFQVCHKAGK